MEWFSRNKVWVIGIAFFVVSTALRFFAANQTQHPTGWDGYYYVMQVHSWLTYGHMQSPDFSLIYPFLTTISFVVGDPVLGLKIGIALISSLLTGSVYYYLVKREVPLLVVCATCAYLAFSPLVTYFILQFPKNALGMVFFILFIISLKKPGIVTAAFFLCAILTHRMTGAFALLAAVMFAFRYINWKWIVAAVAVVLVLGFLPGILHVSDLRRFEGQFTSVPHWAPFAFTTIFTSSLNCLFIADLAIITIAIIYSLTLIITNRKPEIMFWFALLLFSIFPFFDFNAGNIGHRFFMITPVVVVILISLTTRPAKSVSLIVTGVFIALSFFSYRSYKSQYFDAPNNVYETIVDRLVKRFNPKQYPLVIAHKGLAEMIIFKTDFDALNWSPPEGIHADSILRISHNVLQADFNKYLNPEEIRTVNTISYRYYTLPESTWQTFMSGATRAGNPAILKRIFNGSNPVDQRPYFIGKGKKH